MLQEKMSDAIITVENVSKRYLVGHHSRHSQRYTTFRETIVREASEFARKAVDLVSGRPNVQNADVEEFWALRNVSFEVQQGNVVGIIGPNGAGKSTLLKILSRITPPTEGRILIWGRVASLLEVGTGFHGELTGRENIFLNGAILGMTEQEIRKKFDEIVAFAEVERFLDTPVKRYSSGMHVRLAFAVAAHLEPDILIVDEVLAVGDADFQKKCLGKMDDVSRREGRTVLFVSHNMSVIKTLCPTTIWLDRGVVRRQGASPDVIGEYLALVSPSQDRHLGLNDRQRLHKYDDSLRLLSLEWHCDLPLRHGEPMKGRIRFRARTSSHDLAIGIGFANLEGSRVLTYETDFQEGFRPDISQAGEYSVDFAVESLPLAPDVYALDAFCRSSEINSVDYVPAVAQIEVVAGAKTPLCIVHHNTGVHLSSSWAWANLGQDEPPASPTQI
jgi:lipopolysaccharide transport system ATP-binding protein